MRRRHAAALCLLATWPTTATSSTPTTSSVASSKRRLHPPQIRPVRGGSAASPPQACLPLTSPPHDPLSPSCSSELAALGHGHAGPAHCRPLRLLRPFRAAVARLGLQPSGVVPLVEAPPLRLFSAPLVPLADARARPWLCRRLAELPRFLLLGLPPVGSPPTTFFSTQDGMPTGGAMMVLGGETCAGERALPPKGARQVLRARRL